MKRTLSFVLALVMLFSTFAGMEITAQATPKNGWYKEVYGSDFCDYYWYYYQNWEPVTGWKKIGGELYYFEPEAYSFLGVMYSNCTMEINGIYYVFASSGEVISYY